MFEVQRYITVCVEKVKLTNTVKLKAGNLDSFITELGKNYSVGERQLICLASALLKECHFLIMDEATANVDNETDEIIHKVLSEHFKDYSLITIARRLKTIFNSNRIVVMESGRIVEIGSANELMKREGYFFELMNYQTNQVNSV